MLSKSSVPTKSREKKRTIPSALKLILGLLFFVFVGTFVLMLPGVAKNGTLAFNEAIFTAVSALSVTGLSIITPSVDLTPFGKVVLMGLIQCGGVGYMVLAIMVLRFLGREISLGDRMALQDALGLISSREIVKLTIRVFITVLIIEFVGAVLLWLNWRNIMPADRAAFHAMFHAVSSFCNAGFDLFTGSREFPTDSATLTVMGILIWLGGLGIPVLFDTITYWKRRRFTLHTKLTFIVTTGLVFWGMAGLWIAESQPGGVLDGLPLGRQLGLSLFQSISCRTAGFVGMPNFEMLNPAAQLLIITLMFIGCAPASMGGGVTTGTFVILVLAVYAYLKNHQTPIIWGRAIPGEMIRKASAVLTVSLFVVLTSSWLLLMTHDVDAQTAIFEVVSAFATCGLSLDFTSQLSGFGQTVIMFMMFWGRLGALTLLLALTHRGAKRRVSYPEEKILIG